MKAPLEARIFSEMVSFMQQVQRAADAALAGTGVSPAQFFILSALARQGPQQQSKVAAQLGVTAANVSQLLVKLADAGLVQRHAQGKAKVVSLTANGNKLVTQLQPAHEKFLRSRFEPLKTDERVALLATLHRLTGGGGGV